VDEAAPVTPNGWRLDPGAFSWRFSRASGAGGQHVNTTDSKAELIVDVAALGLPEVVAERVLTALGPDVRVVSSTHRSQRRNRVDALERFATMVDTAARPPTKRRPTRPSKGSVERRITAKRHTSERKADRRWRNDD
jgi:ribosome-associated protein